MKGIELFILISVILNVVLVIAVAIIAHFLRKVIIKLQSIEITQISQKEDLNKLAIDIPSIINNELHQSSKYIKDVIDLEIKALKSTISELENDINQLYEKMNILQEKMHSYQMKIEDLKDFLEKPINIEEYLKGGNK